MKLKILNGPIFIDLFIQDLEMKVAGSLFFVVI